MTRVGRDMGARFACVVLAAFTTLVCAMPAWAQDAVSNAPRQPAVRNMTSAWVGYASMFLIMTLVLMVSLYPSKRGHQE